MDTGHNYRNVDVDCGNDNAHIGGHEKVDSEIIANRDGTITEFIHQGVEEK